MIDINCFSFLSVLRSGFHHVISHKKMLFGFALSKNIYPSASCQKMRIGVGLAQIPNIYQKGISCKQKLQICSLHCEAHHTIHEQIQRHGCTYKTQDFTMILPMQASRLQTCTMQMHDTNQRTSYRGR